MDEVLTAQVSLDLVRKLFVKAGVDKSYALTFDKDVMIDYLEAINDEIEDIILGDVKAIEVVIKFFNENKVNIFGKVAANQTEYKDNLDEDEKTRVIFSAESNEELVSHLIDKFKSNLHDFDCKLLSEELRIVEVEEILYLIEE